MEDFIARITKLGAELKKIRENSNLSVEDISSRLRIQRSYLEAIESGKIELLPSGFYRKTFIKEYCLYLSAENLWQQYEDVFTEIERQKTERAAQRILNEPAQTNKFVREKEEYKPLNRKSLLIGAGVVVTLAIIFAIAFHSKVTLATKGDKVMQLSGGTEVIIEQKKAEERKKQQLEEEKARKLAEERAKAEEASLATESNSSEENTAQTEENNGNPLAENELLISAPNQEITIKATQGEATIFEGKVEKGKSMRFKVEGELPMRVRYENPNKTDVTYGGKEFKPLHPSEKGRTRYYWSDGSVTYTVKKQ